MRKIYEEVRPPTLDELDGLITTAHHRMVEYRDNGEPALAEQCEQKMNRLLDKRAVMVQPAAS